MQAKLEGEVARLEDELKRVMQEQEEVLGQLKCVAYLLDGLRDIDGLTGTRMRMRRSRIISSCCMNLMR